MNRQQLAILKRSALLVLFVLVLAPVSTFAQRRWVTHRNRIVIYQPRPYVIERPRTTYRYRTYTYGYPQSYYSTYYSYRYTQPYFANRYTYSWANPTYRYDYGNRPRHRRSRIIVRWR